MGRTQQRSSRGGIQSVTGLNVEGPALGGLLVIPFIQKIAGAGAFATVDLIKVLTATRLIAAIYQNFYGGAPADVIIQSPSGFTLCPPSPTAATVGSRVAHKEGSGITATDFVWNPVSGGQSEEAGRSIPRDNTLQMRENGASAPAFGTAIQCLVCTRGPVYDPDNRAAGAAQDFPYVGSND